MKTYTVLGVDKTTHESWVECFKADDAEHAREQAIDSAESSSIDLLIAGVIEGVVPVYH
jgi:hypothetical protein